jgi:ubiquitin C-terminal hydrolase
MTSTNPTEAQMKLARECAAHGFPKDMPYYKNCMAGNYDEFGIVQAPLLAIQATEARAQGLVDALNGYKAAVAFVAADAWDGCSDCIDVLKAARCADTVESLTPDEIAANLKRIRLHFQPPAKHSQHGGERER